MAANLGIGLVMQSKKVLLMDTDPQADLKTCLGWPEQDNLPVKFSTLVEKVINNERSRCMRAFNRMIACTKHGDFDLIITKELYHHEPIVSREY